MLNIFRRDEDLYLHTCAAIGIEDRQIGKVAALSLGYGGSVGAFAAMGRAYNVFLPEHQVKGIVDNWRAANPWAVKFWNDLHDAALSAIRFPNQEFSVGHVTYKYIEHLLGGTLVCGIAGQMSIQYPYCTAKIVSGPYGDQWQITAVKANWKPKADAKTWPRVTLWRGLLAENITQAFCALLLRNTVRECSVRELPIVAHVHDEVILEVPTREAELYRVRLQNLMEATPAWAEGLPLKAKPVILQRYGGH